MIRINLISARETEAASSRTTEFILVGVGLAALLGALAWVHLGVQSQLQTASVQVEDLEGQVATIRKKNQEIEKLEQKKQEVEQKLQVVQSLTSPERRAASVHILDDLSSSTPEYLWLTDFTEAKGAAKINGQAVDNQTIASFANDLAKSKYFPKVEIRETAQVEPTQGQAQQAGAAQSIPVKRFLIEATVSYLPSAKKASGTEGTENSAETGKGQNAEKAGGGA